MNLEAKLVEEKWLEAKINTVCEALTPNLQSMLSDKTQELDDQNTANTALLAIIIGLNDPNNAMYDEATLMA